VSSEPSPVAPVTVSADRLEDLVAAVFEAAGCSSGEARRIGHHLVGANLAGHDSHGVVRTLRYVERLRDGTQRADQQVSVVSENDVMAVLDGNLGFGQTIGHQAVAAGIERALARGVAVIALRRSGHLGRIGDWAELAAEAGLVSIHFVNVAGSSLVAPFGALSRRMGTNPVCIGVPRPGDEPLILDFATSVVAEGKAQVALDGGKPLPDDALIGADGVPTGDPSVLYGPTDPGRAADPRRGPGALRAMGEHKGSGLALMCELLAGVLTGSPTAGPDPATSGNGMLSIYLSPDAFAGGGAFAEGVRSYLDWFEAADPAAGVAAVLSPGRPEQQRRRERLAAGIELPGGTWASILAAAASVGIDRPSAERLAGR